jgi:molybdopterin synthase catalytic subunit
MANVRDKEGLTYGIGSSLARDTFSDGDWKITATFAPALLEKGLALHGRHRVFIQHRLGFVAALEPSLLLRVHTKHSAAAFEICQWYLKEIKTTVPIWKKPVWTAP